MIRKLLIATLGLLVFTLPVEAQLGLFAQVWAKALVEEEQSATKNLSITVVAGTSTATSVLCPNSGETGNFANCAPSPTLAFGKQGTSTASMAIPISVNNCATADIITTNGSPCTGTGALVLGSNYATISGTNASDFVIGTGPSNPCSNNLSINSGGFCLLTVTFRPSAAAGTNESATLTISSNGTSPTQTMALTGTSANVTILATSACPTALAASTNYQLSANITCAGTVFTGANNADVNLNGFTLTFGNGTNTSPVQGISLTNVQGVVLHNGVCNEGLGPNTGLVGNFFGPACIGSTGTGNSDSSVQIYNLINSSCHSTWCGLEKTEENKISRPATIIHDVIYSDNDTTQCGTITCRENSQSYAVTLYDNEGEAGTQFYNDFIVGGPQGALNSTATGSIMQYNVVNPGSVPATNTNGFGYQTWGGAGQIQFNLIASTPGSPCTSCRGVQVSNVTQAVSNETVQNNTIRTTGLNNDAEYGNCTSAQEPYSYGMQFNTAGSTRTPFTGNAYNNNKVIVTSRTCGGFAFSLSGGNQTGNTTSGNRLECDLANGVVPAALQACAGWRMDDKQYPFVDLAIISTGDTILGDTSAIHVWFDGTGQWQCNQCTFGPGTNPITGTNAGCQGNRWEFIDFYYGCGAGGGTNLLTFVDPTFLAPATESLTNLSSWASNNATLTSSYVIQFTQTVTVKGAVSGNPISGATVTYTDALSNNYTGTTNASGVAKIIVNENQYVGSGGTLTVTHYNNYSYLITVAGCSNGTASGLNITSPNATNVSLGGC